MAGWLATALARYVSVLGFLGWHYLPGLASSRFRFGHESELADCREHIRIVSKRSEGGARRVASFKDTQRNPKHHPKTRDALRGFRLSTWQTCEASKQSVMLLVCEFRDQTVLRMGLDCGLALHHSGPHSKKFGLGMCGYVAGKPARQTAEVPLV